MEKSKFKQLIQGMVFEVLEGKGDAPGATKKTSLAQPGQVSKGGFTLRDFSKVLSGVAGQRKTGKFYGSRTSERDTKWTLFKGGRNIDKWRLAVLKGGQGVGKTHRFAGKNVTPQHGYMQTKTKTKDVSANITSLASVRKTDNDFQKLGGGRKTRVEGAQMKVSSAYIAQKATAKATYKEMVGNEKNRLFQQLTDIEQGGGEDTIEYVATKELIIDLDLRIEEYGLRWDFATAAYNGDISGMNQIRAKIEDKVNQRKHREKVVGDEHYSTAPSPSPWQEKGNYRFGDTVIGKSGRTFLATAGRWKETELGMIDPEKGHPMWQPQK